MEAEIAFGKRRSPAASLRMALHAGSMHSKHAGFSPGAGTSAAASARVSRQARLTFCCVRLKSAKNLYLRHRFFCKIRQIHRFFCIFRQKLQIL